MERRKLKVEQEDITQRLIEPISPVSGEKMPGQQMLPDIGFEHNPGKVYWDSLAGILLDRLKSYPPALAVQVEKELAEVEELQKARKVQDAPESDLKEDGPRDT